MTGWMIWCSRADPTAPINRIDLPQKNAALFTRAAF
jgi:hypothetical protein